MLGLASAPSMAIPCALIATSFAPAIAPNSINARNKDAASDAIAVPKRQRPRRALLKSNALCTAGIRETQVETIKPWRRNREITAHHAAETLSLKPGLGIASWSAPTI